MKQLFPFKQIMGFIFSLVLTVVALLAYYMGLSFTTGMIIITITAFVQALLQLVVFMHAGETKDKWSIYGNVYFMVFVALVTIFGTMLLFVWDM